jgi:hypothetical protein
MAQTSEHVRYVTVRLIDYLMWGEPDYATAQYLAERDWMADHPDDAESQGATQ